MKRRAISLFLAMVLALLCLSACNGNKTDVSDDVIETEAEETEALGNATHDANGYELDDLPEAMDFGHKEVSILTWDFGVRDFEYIGAEEIPATLIGKAQYDRIDRVESRLNIVFTVNQIAGLQADMDTFLQHAENSNLSGAPYDIVSSYSGIGAAAAMRGLYQNLSDMDYINFEKPWWPEDLQNSVAIGGNIYFASGDITQGSIMGLFSVIANIDMWGDYYGATYGEDYLYELVDTKKWTLDTMIGFSKGLYVDINNNGKDDEDQFGFVVANNVSMDAFLQGCGIDITTKNAAGKIVMADSFFGEQMIDLVAKMGDFYHQDYFKRPAEYGAIFKDGRALFIDIPISHCHEQLVHTEMTYAALPMPLYDEQQKNYVTTMNHNFSVFGILTNVNAEDTLCASAALEALASEGHRNVVPAIFEQGFRLRYSANEDVSRMFQYIRDGLKFDMGRLYRLNFTSKIPDELFRDCIINQTSWYTTVVSRKGQWNRTLGTISDAILALSAS